MNHIYWFVGNFDNLNSRKFKPVDEIERDDLVKDCFWTFEGLVVVYSNDLGRNEIVEVGGMNELVELFSSENHPNATRFTLWPKNYLIFIGLDTGEASRTLRKFRNEELEHIDIVGINTCMCVVILLILVFLSFCLVFSEVIVSILIVISFVIISLFWNGVLAEKSGKNHPFDVDVTNFLERLKVSARVAGKFYSEVPCGTVNPLTGGINLQHTLDQSLGSCYYEVNLYIYLTSHSNDGKIRTGDGSKSLLEILDMIDYHFRENVKFIPPDNNPDKFEGYKPNVTVIYDTCYGGYFRSIDRENFEGKMFHCNFRCFCAKKERPLTGDCSFVEFVESQNFEDDLKIDWGQLKSLNHYYIPLTSRTTKGGEDILKLEDGYKPKENKEELELLEKFTSNDVDFAVMSIMCTEGDCFLVKFEGKYYFIDAGPGENFFRVFLFLKKKKLLIPSVEFHLTHDHRDHKFGFDILESFYNKVDCTILKEMGEWEQMIAKKGKFLKKELQTGCLTFNKVSGSSLRLYRKLPPKKKKKKKFGKSDENRNSVVYDFVYKRRRNESVRVLITGDAFIEDFLKEGFKNEPQVNLFKSPHHASLENNVNSKAISIQGDVIITKFSRKINERERTHYKYFLEKGVETVYTYEDGDDVDPEKFKWENRMKLVDVFKDDKEYDLDDRSKYLVPTTEKKKEKKSSKMTDRERFSRSFVSHDNNNLIDWILDGEKVAQSKKLVVVKDNLLLFIVCKHCGKLFNTKGEPFEHSNCKKEEEEEDGED